MFNCSPFTKSDFFNQIPFGVSRPNYQRQHSCYQFKALLKKFAVNKNIANEASVIEKRAF